MPTMYTIEEHEAQQVKPYIDTKVQNLSTVISKNGAKNLLPLTIDRLKKCNTIYTWSGNTYSVGNGAVTFEVNTDDFGLVTSIVVNANNYASAAFLNFANNNNLLHLDAGTYKLNGGAAGGGENLYCWYIKDSVYRWVTDSDLEVVINSDVDMDTGGIVIRPNRTLVNAVFKPMIRLASDTDPTYEPYAKTNQQLTKETDYLVDNTEVNGAVNMLPNFRETVIDSGITYTVNEDKAVTCNGTATANNHLEPVKTSDNYYLPKGTYKLKGCPSGGTDNTYYIRLYNLNSSAVQIGREYGDGLVFTLTESTRIGVQIQFMSGTNADNLTFKPMITVPSYDGDYVPYAKSNKDLTDDVEELNLYRGYMVPIFHKGHLTITNTSTSRITCKLISQAGELFLNNSGSAWSEPTKVIANRAPGSSDPDWTYKIDGNTISVNCSAGIDGFILFSGHTFVVTAGATSPEPNTLGFVNLYNLTN